MDVSYRWLEACAAGSIGTPREVEERLAARGFPLESVTDLSAGLGDLVVGRVEAVASHPNADRLSVCKVEAGTGAVQVICGAPNVAAGRCYPFAPVGACLPGGLRIRRVKIRGGALERDALLGGGTRSRTGTPTGSLPSRGIPSRASHSRGFSGSTT